jgi:hypothetical protein
LSVSLCVFQCRFTGYVDKRVLNKIILCLGLDGGIGGVLTLGRRDGEAPSPYYLSRIHIF